MGDVPVPVYLVAGRMDARKTRLHLVDSLPYSGDPTKEHEHSSQKLRSRRMTRLSFGTADGFKVCRYLDFLGL